MQTPQLIPAQAADYIRSDDGATMRETAPGEFVNLAVLSGWGFKLPNPIQHARAHLDTL